MTDTVQVPREATVAMLQAVLTMNRSTVAPLRPLPIGYEIGWAARIWEVMLAAAPQATADYVQVPREATEEIMRSAWPEFGGQLQSVEFWEVFEKAVRFTLAAAPQATDPRDEIATVLAREAATTKRYDDKLAEAEAVCDAYALENQQLSDRAEAAESRIATLTARCETLFDAIAHGDQEHRDWLKAAIEAHFVGEAVLPVVGLGLREAIATLTAERDALRARCEAAEAALDPPFAHREDCAGACLDVTCLGCFNAGLRAAQAENEKLRAQVREAHRYAYMAAWGPINEHEHKEVEKAEEALWLELTASPPLSPETPRPAWMDDPDRRPWVTNSLDYRIKETQREIQKLRRAFAKDYMGEPANWLADAYAEALAALVASRVTLPPLLSPEKP